MARPYSNDLRRKLLEAHDQGKGTLAELADQFGVSLAWAWKISSARKRTGSAERQPYQAGPKMLNKISGFQKFSHPLRMTDYFSFRLLLLIQTISHSA